MTTNYKCFLDVDGVICDFTTAAFRIHGREYDPDKDKFEAHNIHRHLGMSLLQFTAPMTHEFWESLEKTKEADLILNTVIETFTLNKVALFTSAPVNNHSPYFWGRIKWIKKHYPQFENRYIIGTNKFLVANSDVILIDDSEHNIKLFREHGGVGLLVPRPWNGNIGTIEEMIDQIKKLGVK